MRMQKYPIRDVPRGKRAGYIWTYYKWHIIALICGISLAVWMIYMFFFHPRTDVSVMWISSEYELLADTVIKERLSTLPWDLNGDGKVSVAVQHVEYTEDGGSNMETQMTLTTLIASGSFNVFWVTDAALEWFLENDLAAAWSDVIPGSDRGEEIFCIPCQDLEFFRGDGLASMEGLYLVAARPSEYEEKNTVYRQEMEALRALMEWTEKVQD